MSETKKDKNNYSVNVLIHIFVRHLRIVTSSGQNIQNRYTKVSIETRSKFWALHINIRIFKIERTKLSNLDSAVRKFFQFTFILNKIHFKIYFQEFNPIFSNIFIFLEFCESQYLCVTRYFRDISHTRL